MRYKKILRESQPQERDWLEKLFLKSIEKALPDFEATEENMLKLSEAIDDSLQFVIDLFEKNFHKRSKKILKQNKKDISKFKKRLNKTWQPAFDKLEIFISFNLEYGVIVSGSYQGRNEIDVKFDTLLRLHTRSCRIASEILELLKGGFADGAMARWRSLHEISVISSFLEKGTAELCQRYLDHYYIENYHELMEYQKNCEKLGYEPFSDEDVEESKKLVEAQREKYGTDFMKLYGWIGDALPKKKRNFAGIEENVEFNFMRSFYKMANNSVHSGAKGFIYTLGQYDDNQVMLAGPSNYGFADPGQNAAYSLFQTTLTLSEFETYSEDAVYVQIGMNMLKDLGKEFVRIQKNIEDEEDEIRKYNAHNP